MRVVKVRCGKEVERHIVAPELDTETSEAVYRAADKLEIFSDDWVRLAIEHALANPGEIERRLELERFDIKERDRGSS